MRLWPGIGVAVVAAVTATGAFGVTGSDRITTIAGVGKFGTGGFSGDGGPATKALLAQPKAVAVDAQGNVYIADARNNRVRKVTPSGKITTIAGNGQEDVEGEGDGGPATSAFLNHPNGVAVDRLGNVYIAAGHRVRKVSPNGTITTFAGGPCRGISLSSCPLGDGGPATLAWLRQPHGVGVDALGNVYIAEYTGNRVRKVSPDGTITTFAGTGKAGFSGNGGPATSAQLHAPAGVAVDARGNVYIADQQNVRVRKVSPGGTITTFAGSGVNGFAGEGRPATAAQMSGAFGVAVDRGGNVYIADTGLARVLKVAGGRLTRIAGRDPRSSGGLGEGGPATSAQMSAPWGVAVDGKGNVYVVDSAYNTVRKVWNGSTTTSTAPKQRTSGKPERRAFYSPSRNLFCDLVAAGVNCTSRTPPHVVRLGPNGGITICRGIGCIGNPGETDPQPTPTLLAYGKQITVGRFRCLSLQTGVRCTVIQSGKGFLINRDGASRLGQ